MLHAVPLLALARLTPAAPLPPLAAVLLLLLVAVPPLVAVLLPPLVAVPQRPLVAVLLQVAVPLPDSRDDQIAALIALSEKMAMEGRTLIERVLPQPPATYTQYAHYPEGDAIDPDSNARWFYHAHAPEARGENEHGHFHLFLPKSAFGKLKPIAKPKKKGAAEVVHVAALCFDLTGMPTHWIATNQWVTEEFLYPAEAIIPRLDRMEMEGAGVSKDIPHVGAWLSLALALAREDISALLLARDEALAKSNPRDMAAEILAQTPFALS